MSDENKELNASGSDEADKGLKKELEALKDTFQDTYDKTAEEAVGEPVIQELEDSVEEADTDDETEAEADTDGTEAASEKGNGKKSGKKKKHRAGIAIAAVVCVLIIVPLLAFFIASVAVPDFSNLVGCLTNAYSADAASDKISYYEKALEYCKDDSKLSGFRQTVLEDIVTTKCTSEGYAAALKYMNDNMTEEEIAAASSSDFKSFLKIGDNMDTLTNGMFQTVKNAIGTTGTEPDYDTLMKDMKVPELIKAEVKTILQSIATGIIAEGNKDVETASSDFLTAYNSLTTLGAGGQEILEQTALSMYNAGFAYNAYSVITNYITEDMLAATIDPAFAEMKTALDAVSAFPESIYTLAEGSLTEDTSDENYYTELVKHYGEYSEPVTTLLASLVESCAKAIKAENEKNLTAAMLSYTSVMATEKAFGLTDNAVIERAFLIEITTGSLSDAQTTSDTYVNDAFLETASAEFKEAYNGFKAFNTALETVSGVFSPYYQSYYYGSAIDSAALNAELDALITETSTAYDKAAVYYYKYAGETLTNADMDTMIGYMNEFVKALPVYAVFGDRVKLDIYYNNKDYTSATDIAQNILNIDSSDDTANMVFSFNARRGNDLETALNYALKGIESAGTASNCAYQAAIIYILNGENDKAYTYIKALYDNALSMSVCELVTAFNALYDGGDETIKASLTEMVANIEQIFSSNSYTHYDDTTAIVNGTKTAADVFLSDDCDLS